jgi:hypothetical protein
MQGAVTLMEKKVAMAALRTDLQLLNQYLLRKPAAARQRADRLAALLVSLPADALTMQPAILNELRSGVRLFLSMKKQQEASSVFGTTGENNLLRVVGDAVWSAFYLPNASANEHLRLHGRILAVDGLSGEAYRHALADARQHAEAEEERVYVLRNPVGHVLVNISIPSYGNYFLRRDDLVALRAMVAFQLELLRRNVSDPEAIAQALPAAALNHPFTGAEPVWNKSTRTLIHAALAERNGGKTLELRL